MPYKVASLLHGSFIATSSVTILLQLVLQKLVASGSVFQWTTYRKSLMMCEKSSRTNCLGERSAWQEKANTLAQHSDSFDAMLAWSLCQLCTATVTVVVY